MLSATHRCVLHAIAGPSFLHGAWPTFESVRAQLGRDGIASADCLLRTMPHGLVIFRDPPSDYTTLALTMEGMLAIHRHHDVVDLFLHAVRLSATHCDGRSLELGARKEPAYLRADVIFRARPTAPSALVRLVGLLLEAEGLGTLKSTGEPLCSWAFKPKPWVELLRRVTGPDDYRRRRQRLPV